MLLACADKNVSAGWFLGVLGGFFVLLIGGNIATNWILLRMVEDDFYNQFFR
jgi:hypothetical protein